MDISISNLPLESEFVVSPSNVEKQIYSKKKPRYSKFPNFVIKLKMKKYHNFRHFLIYIYMHIYM